MQFVGCHGTPDADLAESNKQCQENQERYGPQPSAVSSGNGATGRKSIRRCLRAKAHSVPSMCTCKRTAGLAYARARVTTRRRGSGTFGGGISSFTRSGGPLPRRADYLGAWRDACGLASRYGYLRRCDCSCGLVGSLFLTSGRGKRDSKRRSGPARGATAGTLPSDTG